MKSTLSTELKYFGYKKISFSKNQNQNYSYLYSPGPPEFTEELHMRQETDGVLLESYLIYEPEHQATWFKEDKPLLGALDFDEKYQVFDQC